MAKLSSFMFCFLFLVVHNDTLHKSVTDKNDDNKSYLDPEITKLCTRNETMFIRGNDVKTSDFVRKNGEIYNLCSYDTDLKFIYVFALNSLVIDMDVNVYGSYLKLYFIAPIWVVVGNRKISVDGSKGDYIPQAEDGNDTNVDGEDGKPGLPGGPGGNFFGIGESFVNGKKLTITASGGIGGTGQCGGKGYNQIKARYVDIGVLGKIWCGLYYDICRGKDRKYQLNLQDNYGNYSNFSCIGLYEEENMERCSYKLLGWEGEEGGKGGSGGRGGQGGLPGSIKLLDVKGSSQISTYNITGKGGKDGRGGIGGRSGQNGHNVIYEDFYFLAPPKINFELEQEYDYRFGPNGSDGLNSVGLESPLNADVLKPYEILSTINKYKKWLREKSTHTRNNSISVTFYKHIDENIYVRDLCNTSEFLSEVQSIDEEFVKLKSTVNFLPFYHSLLERIYYYAETYENDTNHLEDREILSLLYTEILGRIYNFNEHADTYLVIQIPEYLELVKENLRKVSRLISGNATFDLIAETVNELNAYKENYDSQVKNLINKFRHYVDSKLILATDALMQKESTKMNSLVSEMIRFKERPLNYEQELLRWGKHLQDSLIIRSNVYFIRLSNRLLITLSDFAESVSSVVEVGAEVPEVLRLGVKPTTKPKFSLDTFKRLYTKIDAIKTEEIAEIGQLLQVILNTTKNNLEILFDMSEEVLIIKKKLTGKNRFLTVNALKSDLLQAAKIKKDELSSMKLVFNGNIHNSKAYQHISNAKSAFTDLSRIIRITTLSRGFIELYNEYKNNNSKLDTIVEYIEKTNSVLNSEKRNEDGIYIVIYQLLQRMEDAILATLENSETVSKLTMEVFNWDIPLILDNIKQKSQEFTDNHRAKANLVNIIENLGGACSAFTGLFERVQNYLHQKQLENHIADTTSAINKGINFNSTLFATKYETIKKAFGSNLVLQHYKKAADTFKQYVFPLADVYFQDIILPSHFNIYDDMANTVSVAMTQIDLMLEKVEEYKESLLNGNGIVERKQFGGRKFRSANPFFVWKNEQYKDIIEKFLSGDEVTINAEIRKGDLSDHAIKFNNIDFYFTAKNESTQDRINFLMADYEVTTTHMGNSHYRYGEELYLITSDSLSMSYNFEINEDTGRPETVGGAYDYLSNVDITLSPYALWKVQLVPLWDEVSFDSLLVFKDLVDLELGGNGYYISKEKIRTLDLKVNQFYKPLRKYDG